MTKQEQLIEYTTRDIIEYYIIDEKAEMKGAIALFYNSQISEKLNDIETGLYLESSAYVYDLFRDELRYGRIVQKEV